MQPLKNPTAYKVAALVIMVAIALVMEVGNAVVWSTVLGVR